ncbi:MAG: hemerythrin family protein [Planctomycetes bacterium]|nr:hemerythrin family protein [Planctomycetota bacterium]
MSLVSWSTGLSTGVPMIDEHHARLIGLINRLHSAMKIGTSKSDIPWMLDELVDYTRYGFSEEEKLMAAHDYPRLVEHCEQHQQFAARLGDFQSALAAGDLGLPLKVLTFLREWLLTHIRRDDRAFGPYVTSGR